ncbi:helix-turn-helix transcriptional regulator [Streptomyces sp. NBC_01789]|uniref:telomere-associated protein Tap n=1 Tax=Streptomyces sp. NBC_01789 TaxID=2975941 RepID=UPI002259EEC3|nr:helix-turn-helix domain-containing protein [Streptomyces sp. NBC_01789]MCX4451385.1 helix-turn-helix domain-containing protein [Streptomyces sp. NBC_01789]
MSHEEQLLFSAVDALLEQIAQDPLPPPAERKRLREAAGLSQDQVAKALGSRRESVGNWESGRSEPRPPKRAAYARLLEGLAARFAPEAPVAPKAPGGSVAEAVAVGAPAVARETGASADVAAAREPAVGSPADESDAPAGAPEARSAPREGAASVEKPAAEPRTTGSPASRTAAASVDAPAAEPRTADGPVLHGAGVSVGAPDEARRAGSPAPRKAVAVAAGRRATGTGDAPRASHVPGYEHGPLAVVDVDGGEVSAYCAGGLLLDVPAKSLPGLVEWALYEAGLGAPRLHPWGQDADPLLVLTEAACERFGLPARLSQEESLAGRLPEGHKVLKQLERADWKLTRRGFGPWARIYRPARGSRRSCVQLCVPSWNALDVRHWGGAEQLPPAELVRLLGTYASRVMTPRGSTAVTGLELMTSLHPPTRASAPDADGTRHSERNPGSLGTEPVECAPCEAPDGHPLLADLPRFHQRGPAEMLFEEAYDWARPLTDDECLKRHLVGIDVNLAFGAAANGAVVGLEAPVHVDGPAFDPSLPGSWLVDLSHVDLSHVVIGKQWRRLEGDLLPSPFTPKGDRPEGPAWYATPTVAYAVELGYEVAPVEAWVRPVNGRYLDGWYKRLRDAYVATMADLGVVEGMAPHAFLAAMEGYRARDPQLAVVLSAIKATVKGGIGKLRERPRGGGWRPGKPWPALSRPTWRPDIRAAVISHARINMHRKMMRLAGATGQYPVAVLSDCAVYASDGPSPLDFLPYRDGKPLPGGFRLGVSPGMVKHEGSQTTLWAEAVREEYGPELNLARYIKDGTVTAKDDGE